MLVSPLQLSVQMARMLEVALEKSEEAVQVLLPLCQELQQLSIRCSNSNPELAEFMWKLCAELHAAAHGGD